MPIPGMRAGLTPVQTVDELARLTLDRAQPVRFETARSEADRQSIYALRYSVVTRRGWADPRVLPDGREQDEYDPIAIHLVARKGSALLGTTRFVLPSPDRLLPTEAAFDLRLESMRVVDHSRTVVSPEYRDRGHLVFMGLLFQTWFEVRKRGYTRLCGTASDSVRRLSDRLGIVLDIYGPGRDYWGEIRYAYVWAPEQSYEALADRWGRVVGFGPASAPAVEPNP
jgi:N-acyl-L-homoserine lactone synthetase